MNEENVKMLTSANEKQTRENEKPRTVYAFYTYSIELPGACDNQICFESFSGGKKEFLESLLERIDGDREPLLELGTEETEDELKKMEDDISSLIGDPRLEGEKLDGRFWQAGDLTVEIHLCAVFPEVLSNFRATVQPYVEEYELGSCFELDDEEYEELEAEEDPEYLLYRDFFGADENMSEADFENLFSRLGDELSAGSVF